MVLNRGHEGLNRHWKGRLAQVVETSREEIRVHRGELETRVSQINGPIKGWAVGTPLRSKPMLNVEAVLKHSRFELT
jgi:hypothetical protein